LGSVALAGLLLGGCAETGKPAATARPTQPAKPKLAYKVGNPYQIDGVWYYPTVDYNYDETGVASWYGPDFDGKDTALGETYDMNDLTAAHRTLPMPSMVRVTNLENGRVLALKVNDRGPYAKGRILDVSRRGAQLLGFDANGTARVRVQIMAEESRLMAAQAQAGQPVALLPGKTKPQAAPTAVVVAQPLAPPPGEPAAWVTEDVIPVPKNIYGVTKAAAEDLCQIFARNHALRTIVLRTSRFFPEEDDARNVREAYADANAKTNEFLYRRVDIEDVVSAHLLAADRAPSAGFAKYIISATTPFSRHDVADLRNRATQVVRRYVPEYEQEYARRSWTMVPDIDRVYANDKARAELGWQPRHDFRALISRLKADDDIRSPLAREIGRKGYHDRVFSDGPYPVT